MDSFEMFVQSQVKPIVDVTVRLATMSIRLVSNVSGFAAQHYFSKNSQNSYANESTDFELWCVSISASNLNIEMLIPYVDQTYRSKSFAAGYYVTDHFGAPVHIITRGQCYYVFGEALEHVVWPYFVKYFLMLHCLKNESLHLKAAACSIDSAGTLLLGRGGAGKTVFLTQLCLHGAHFVSNSHSIIKDGRIYGVASSLRIRPGPWFADLVGSIKTNQALIPGELIIDPYDVFAVDTIESIDTRNVCILNFEHSGKHEIRSISKEAAYDYAEQFSLAINVYRLEEDLLDLFKGDYRRFSQVYKRMKEELSYLIKKSRCYYITSDMLNPNYRNEVLTLLARH